VAIDGSGLYTEFGLCEKPAIFQTNHFFCGKGTDRSDISANFGGQMPPVRSIQMFDRRNVPLGIVMMLLSFHAAIADTATNTLSVSLTVVQTCTVDTGTLTFPTGTFGTSIQTPAATITVTCNTGSTAPSVSIGVGSNAVGAVVPRRLKRSGALEYINYALTSGATAIVTDTAMPLTDNGNATYSAAIYATATVPASATIGVYSDSVVMTVTYTQ
jgi:hypothetical protein